MTSANVLLDAVKESLDKEGLTGKVKSEIRQEVLRLLGVSCLKKDKKKPVPPEELEVINSLVKEYLQWVGYSYTSTMLTTESSTKKQRQDISRKEMENSLHLEAIGADNQDLPLLYILINHLKNNTLLEED